MADEPSRTATPVTIAEWIEWGRTSLETHLDHPEEESRFLMEAVLRSRTRVWTQASAALKLQEASRFQDWIARRVSREPFHLIVGEVDFCGRPLTVRPGVLIPRPETELVVQCCVRELSLSGRGESPLRILDLGAGSGAISISLLLDLPNWSGVAVEREPEALSVLRENRRRYGLEKRLSVICGDWGTMLAPEPVFDCIVSNPPYIPTSVIESLEPEVRCYEPKMALDGGPDGVKAYREILSFAPPLLKDHGILVFEIGADQACAEPFRAGMKEFDPAGHLGEARILKDVSGRDRIIFWKKEG
jgi:release factor glutamine methyltransferase